MRLGCFLLGVLLILSITSLLVASEGSSIRDKYEEAEGVWKILGNLEEHIVSEAKNYMRMLESLKNEHELIVKIKKLIDARYRGGKFEIQEIDFSEYLCPNTKCDPCPMPVKIVDPKIPDEKIKAPKPETGGVDQEPETREVDPKPETGGVDQEPETGGHSLIEAPKHIVAWRNVVGSKGNVPGYLEKLDTREGWNAGAVSIQSITEKGDNRGVYFEAKTNNHNLMAGLSFQGDRSVHYNSINLAIYLRKDHKFSVYEDGVHKGAFGFYEAGDSFTVEIMNGDFIYTHNGKHFYTSKTPVQFPLIVDTSIHSPGAAIKNVKIIDHWIAHLAAVGSPVVWKNVERVHSTPGSLERVIGSGWNSGAFSLHSIGKVGDIRGIEFVCKRADKALMIGLSGNDVNRHHNSIEFSIYCASSGEVLVYESGNNVGGKFGLYTPEDKFSIIIDQFGQVSYRKNGDTFYYSAVEPKYPLYVEASLHSMGAVVDQVKFVGKPSEDHLLKAGEFVTFTKQIGVQAPHGEGTIEKIRMSNSWDSSAISALHFDPHKDKVVGITFDASTTNKNLMIGLNDRDSTSSYTDIAYAIYLRAGGNINIYEKGVNRGLFTSYKQGDEFAVVYRNNHITYSKNGVVFYTSNVKVESNLFVDCSFHGSGAKVENIRWVEDSKKGAPMKAGNPVEWNRVSGVFAGLGDIEKVHASKSWNHGGESKYHFRENDDVMGVEFECNGNRNMMMGLGNNADSYHYERINFAIYCRENGLINIYESGTNRGVFGSYKKGDKFAIQVNQFGEIVYKYNGNVFHYSHIEPQFPLHVRASIHSHGGHYQNVKWLGKDNEKHKINIGSPVPWRFVSGAKATPGIVEKTKSGNSWDSGAISSLSIDPYSDNVESRKVVGFEFQCDGRTPIMAGLSSENNLHHHNSIQYALYCTANKQLVRFERGSKVEGVIATYTENDILGIEYRHGQIVFLQNGKVISHSFTPPKFPLFVDVSIHTNGGKIQNARWHTSDVEFQEAKAGNLVDWTNVVGTRASMGHLAKSKNGLSWNAGATSVATIKRDSKVQGVSWKSSNIISNQMIGISSFVPGKPFTGSHVGIDFKLYLRTGGGLLVYDKGQSVSVKGGPYDAGKEFALRVRENKVEFIYDGQLLYTSKNEVEYPLRIETSLNSPTSEIYDVRWIE